MARAISHAGTPPPPSPAPDEAGASPIGVVPVVDSPATAELAWGPLFGFAFDPPAEAPPSATSPPAIAASVPPVLVRGTGASGNVRPLTATSACPVTQTGVWSLAPA